MKHLVGVAELNSWALAIDDAVKLGMLKPVVGTFLAQTSAAYTRSYLEGNRVNGKLLSDLKEDNEMFEEVLNEISNDDHSGSEIGGYNE